MWFIRLFIGWVDRVGCTMPLLAASASSSAPRVIRVTKVIKVIRVIRVTILESIISCDSDVKIM